MTLGHRVIQALWGDIRGEELKKFFLLALGSFCLIGAYWPLRTLKDVVFINMVGAGYQPEVKTCSVLFLLPLVLLYSALIHHFKKEHMIYVLVAIYAVVGIGFVWLLRDPIIGLYNTVAAIDRYVAWAFYLYVESFNALMCGLFWSYINDVTTPESAKKGYGLIIFGTQLGGTIFTVLGRYLSSDETLYFERAPLIALISIVLFCCLALVVWVLTRVVSRHEFQGYVPVAHQKDGTEKGFGFLDGIWVIARQPYLLGIFGLVFFQDCIATLMEYQFGLMVQLAYTIPGLRHRFMFDYAVMVQATSCVFALFGTSYFQRKFSIVFCLVAYPLILGVVIFGYMMHPTLYMIALVMIVAKALQYAFSQPTKDILYIPASKTAKYSSKAWIDMFGQRFAKVCGAQISKALGFYTNAAGLASLLLIGSWVVLGEKMGKAFNRITKNNEVID